mgnify:CR=1 FL=1
MSVRPNGTYIKSHIKEDDKYEVSDSGRYSSVVICQLEAGERMITEGGGMSWMSPNMKMETTTNGGIGKAVGRMFSGEKMFQNIYTAQGATE